MRGPSGSERSSRPRVCIVTPGYLSSTPRVVREADALSAAGFDVRVAFTQGPLAQLRSWDEELLSTRPWSTSISRWAPDRDDSKARYYWSGLRHRVTQAAPAVSWMVPGVLERAEGRIFPELRAVAASEPADMFIGHYPIGLAAAAQAAARYGAKLGYDVEDLYAETFPPTGAWMQQRARILRVEARYVPGCSHVSAVSVPVANAFSRMFPSHVPVAVHNCLPWSDRANLDGRRVDRRGAAPSLFWFSQTVGLDRGLQDAIAAMGLVEFPVELHVRGYASSEVQRVLTEIASGAGVAEQVHFHPPCSSVELLSRAAEHDIGLALETDEALNKCLTVSNKLFTYLTAGLAVAATDLPGQRSIVETCPAAAQLYVRGDARALADHIRAWGMNRDRLEAAKQASLLAAEVRWNAECEQASTVKAVARLIGSPYASGSPR